MFLLSVHLECIATAGPVVMVTLNDRSPNNSNSTRTFTNGWIAAGKAAGARTMERQAMYIDVSRADHSLTAQLDFPEVTNWAIGFCPFVLHHRLAAAEVIAEDYANVTAACLVDCVIIGDPSQPCCPSWH